MLEMRFKRLIRGSEPTIIDPESYKKRFVEAVKKYFIAMCIQNEKTLEASMTVARVEKQKAIVTDTIKTIQMNNEKS